ncbi:hypothetical protein L6164_004707 [Bauhinia variegata]|uniref:Uncharacterized protein n=1 Tax=Bauhinia variegata TaxID=167791 RepID=A0ACB9PNT0_BAUVA|nr:hypothetical protein L6164_004707 [Bauhinia variegata]
MISSEKIIEMSRKWRKHVTTRKRRKRISRPRTWENANGKAKCSSSISNKAAKGHFVVYSTDQRRFMLPLIYLNTEIFRELFKLAEEEFGLSSNVPLTLPCEGTVLEYVIMLIQRNVAKDLEEAVLMSVATTACQSTLHLHQQQILLANLFVDFEVNVASL